MSLKPGEITNKFSLTYPAKFEVVERWIVYIIDEDGLATGEEEYGNSPEEAIQNAQSKIDIMMQLNEDQEKAK